MAGTAPSRGGRRARRWTRRLYSLRALVLAINLVVLVLPIIGIASLRMMENFLHRQTEARLIAEATYIRALYLRALADLSGGDLSSTGLGRRISDPAPPKDAVYDPVFPEIDLLFDPILPPVGDPPPASAPADPLAVEAGRRIAPVIEEAHLQNLSGARVLDAGGVAVASSGGEVGCDFRGRPEVDRALAGRYAGVVRERARQPSHPGVFNRDSRVRVHVALPIMKGDRLFGVVYLNRTSLSLFRDVWETEYTIALVAVLALTVIIGLVLGAVITRPLRDLVLKARRIAAGERVESLAVGRTAPREARDLAEALSAMLASLDRNLAYVREFTRGVSHELKTPIASVRGAVELLSSGWREMTDEERERFLGMMEADAKRMDRIVKRLTELARIETRPLSEARIDLAAFAGARVATYREAGHDVAFAAFGPCEVRLPEDLAETLLVNLVENALKHGRGEGVEVRVEQGPRMIVRDRGPGISAANLPRVFERFFTTARGTGGTGLGLAIVKAIAEANGASVAVESGPAGTAFTIDFTDSLSG